MRTAILALIVPLLSACRADDADEAVAKAVKESQVTIQIDRGNKRSRFQATVVARDDPEVTVLTAGHGLGPADRGRPCGSGGASNGPTAKVGKVAGIPTTAPAPSATSPGPTTPPPGSARGATGPCRSRS